MPKNKKYAENVVMPEIGKNIFATETNYAWNDAWTLFTQKKSIEALPYMEKTTQIDPDHPEMLYDLAVIRLAAGQTDAALQALAKAVGINPKLKTQARVDDDLAGLNGSAEFNRLTESK